MTGPVVEGAILTTPPPAVYACIAKVSALIAKTGIAKDRSNAQQGYKFRGIDDVYNALAPMLADNGLVILPRILSRELTQRTSNNGGTLFSVTVEAEFDFVAASDGSRHTVRTFGEAMDSGDKATNKAMSAAYKYAAFQAFCIPTEGDNDADSTTHAVAARPAARPEHAQERQPGDESEHDEPTGELRVVDVPQRELSNGKTQYTVVFSDGLRATTIQPAVGAMANMLKVDRRPVRRETTVNGNFTNLMRLAPAEPVL